MFTNINRKELSCIMGQSLFPVCESCLAWCFFNAIVISLKLKTRCDPNAEEDDVSCWDALDAEAKSQWSSAIIFSFQWIRINFLQKRKWIENIQLLSDQLMDWANCNCKYLNSAFGPNNFNGRLGDIKITISIELIKFYYWLMLAWKCLEMLIEGKDLHKCIGV